MPNYLTLCQDVARESGTFSNVGDPLTVVNQTGRLLRLTHWVNDAWGEIQREQPRWRWMMAEVTGDTVVGVTGYSGAALGVSDRFLRWEPYEVGEESEVSAWDADIGRSDEGFLRFYPWQEFRRMFQSGEQATRTGKPVACSIAPNGELTVYPIPDKAYKLRCQYCKTAQALAVDADTPEMPEDFHDAIKWKALVYLGMFDEATTQISMWQSKYARVMEHLRNAQLPHIQHGGPLA